MTQMLDRSESQPSVQEEIYKTLLTTPHRAVDETLQIHAQQIKRDPFLYGCLAVYAVIEGKCAVRDIQDVFIATLFVSEFSEHREAAWVMFQDVPPFRAKRIISYVTGYAELVKHTSQDDPMPRQGEFGVTYTRAKNSEGQEIAQVTKKIGTKIRRHVGNVSELVINTYMVKHQCLGRPINRVVRNAIQNYLQFRESNRDMMEGAILRAKNALKYLYAKAHLCPQNDENGWVNKALFKNEVSEDSRLGAMKKLAACDDPTEQAKIIMSSKLPYPVIQSLVETITPSILVALISSMTPQELLSNLGKLKKEGAFENPEIKELIHQKLADTKTAKKGKVDALKGEIAAKAVSTLDKDTLSLVSQVTDAQLKQHGSIGVSTLLVVDRSSSMDKALAEAKRVGSALAQACGNNFKGCYLFNSTSYKLSWSSQDGDITQYSSWQKKLKMFTANGMTDLGSCMLSIIENNDDVDQIIILTDEEENGSTRFHDHLPRFVKKFGHMPDIVIVRFGLGSNSVEKGCKAAGANVSVLDCTKVDSISLPNLIQLCSKKSTLDLVQEILKLPLPTKQDWTKGHSININNVPVSSVTTKVKSRRKRTKSVVRN